MITLNGALRRHSFAREVVGGKERCTDCLSVAELHACNTLTPEEWARVRAQAALREMQRVQDAKRRAAEAFADMRHDRMAEEWEASHAQQRGA